MPFTNHGLPAQDGGGFGHRDWSIRELYHAAGWSENFIYGLIRSGEIKAYKRGRVTSIVGQSVDDYRARNAIQPQTDAAA
ncbi:MULTISPECIES: helix-turn-helix domain-containing protein [unclassified Ruegeria]|uniref:helix-turn-helix domain-containing protein n=1 Tax=unclassified Ruegeria TaxID=2625375 RepID=UPI0014894B30|nr:MULTISPECIES: helix-turn-helix domain-containing protein [unclassified Ruegeria]